MSTYADSDVDAVNRGGYRQRGNLYRARRRWRERASELPNEHAGTDAQEEEHAKDHQANVCRSDGRPACAQPRIPGHDMPRRGILMGLDDAQQNGPNPTDEAGHREPSEDGQDMKRMDEERFRPIWINGDEAAHVRFEGGQQGQADQERRHGNQHHPFAQLGRAGNDGVRHAFLPVSESPR